MLHGMCGEARRACDFWSDAGREGSWLVCPAGNARCGERDDWKGTGEEKAGVLDQAMEAVDRAYGAAAVTHAGGDILIGFSRGAFVARDVAYARPGRFRALVLLGASMTPDAARLKASGIRRIVMGAGEYDGARLTMQRAARALDAAGIPTRYESLGRIPHALPNDLEDILRDALAWIREDPLTSTCSRSASLKRVSIPSALDPMAAARPCCSATRFRGGPPRLHRPIHHRERHA
jgi:pimeloyl-ACP methyl ester carboxylesterase